MILDSGILKFQSRVRLITGKAIESVNNVINLQSCVMLFRIDIFTFAI